MKSGLKKLAKRLALCAAFAVAATGIYSYKVEPNILRTTHYDVDTKKWPANEPALHIAVASDLHVGCPSVDIEKVHKIVGRLNAMNADMIVLPGDFVTMRGEDKVIGGVYVPPAEIAAALKDLHAPLGVYAVLGNHDNMNDPDGMRQALESVGIRVIDNDAVHIVKDGFDLWIAGLSDDTTTRPDWKKAAEKITGDAPVVVITHDPGVFVDRNDRPVVTIAAHTHGGQFMPLAGKLFGNPYSRAPVKYMYGHIREEGRDLIVTSGIGTSIIPLRLGARPEVVDVDIHADKASPRLAGNDTPPQKPPGPG